MATMMNPAQTQLPHRKPIPRQRGSLNPQAQATQEPRHPSPLQNVNPYILSQNPSNGAAIYHGQSQYPGQTQYPQHQQQQQQLQQQRAPYNQAPARTPSTATSLYSNPQDASMQRLSTNASMPRRSTSSRSNGSSGSPTSYVALMRKQKATVWCDRSQHEDPRVLAQHRAAKIRAAMQVAGGKHHGVRTSTSSSNQGSVGIRSKIRHQGAPKAAMYTGGANMSGAGVPPRLSATEVDDELSDEGFDAKYARYHQRTNSGRSSLGGGNRTSSNYDAGVVQSNGSTPSAGHSPADSMGLVQGERTPVPGHSTNAGQSDYFAQTAEDEAEERYDAVGQLPPSDTLPIREFKFEDDLRRRGSVDDRAMTMSTGRLFVANPDLSD